MTIKRLKALAGEAKKKPTRYRHICWAGGGTQWLNKQTAARIYECHFVGQRLSQAPDCQACNGKHDAGIAVLSNLEKQYNLGIDALSERIGH